MDLEKTRTVKIGVRDQPPADVIVIAPVHYRNTMNTVFVYDISYRDELAGQARTLRHKPILIVIVALRPVICVGRLHTMFPNERKTGSECRGRRKREEDEFGFNSCWEQGTCKVTSKRVYPVPDSGMPPPWAHP